MAWFWKLRASVHHGVSRIVGIIVVIVLILAAIFIALNAQSVWAYINNLMGFHW